MCERRRETFANISVKSRKAEILAAGRIGDFGNFWSGFAN